MNRTIKFRGICVGEGEFKGKWAYGDLIQKNGLVYITPHSNAVEVKGHIGKIMIMHEVDPETVGQFAERKDKTDTEIYDFDIVKDSDERYGVVYWNPDDSEFSVDFQADMEIEDISHTHIVCGNYWENGDLLK